MKALNRRQLLRGASAVGSGFALASLLPAWAQSATVGADPSLPTLSGPNIDLRIGHSSLSIDGRAGHAVAS